MNTNITKALRAANDILKGTAPSGVDATTLTDALLDLGTLRKRAGETREQAFARLVRENDADAVTLSKAIDALYVADQQRDTAERRTVKARLHRSATDQIDEHVALNKREGESAEQCAARLARGDVTFVKLWQQLRSVQDDL